jgi:hypothetical protein
MLSRTLHDVAVYGKNASTVLKLAPRPKPINHAMEDFGARAPGRTLGMAHYFIDILGLQQHGHKPPVFSVGRLEDFQLEENHGPGYD